MRVNGLMDYKAIETYGANPAPRVKALGLIPEILAVGGVLGATAIGLYGVKKVTAPEFTSVVTQPVTQAVSNTTQNVLIVALLMAGLYFISRDTAVPGKVK